MIKKYDKFINEESIWKKFKKKNIENIEYEPIPIDPNNVDPLGEEDWDEDYDIIIEKPGVLLKHAKNGGPGNWTWEVNFNRYWEYLKERNPHFNEADKKFYCGVGVGFMMANEYHKKITNK